MKNIEEKVIRLLEKHKIVFWHDEEGQFQFDFETIEMEGVVKHRLGSQDFKMRNEIYGVQKETKYLIYHPGALPPDEDNYLLEILLSSKNFKADKISELIEVLEMEDSFRSLLAEYQSFFKSKERVQRFRDLTHQVCDKETFVSALLASVLKVGPDDFDIVTQGLLSGYNQDSRWEELSKLKLTEDYVILLSSYLNYDKFSDQSTENLKDIFLRYENHNFKLFLDRWRRDLNYQHYFDSISVEIFDNVISGELEKHSPTIEQTDLFKQVEYSWLVKLLGLLNKGVDYQRILEIIRGRKESYWYSRYELSYETIAAACNFFICIESFTLQTDFDIIIQNYVKADYLIDSYYRKYYYYKSRIDQQALDFAIVDQRIDKFYESDFLLKINLAFTNAIQNNSDSLKQAIDQSTFYKSKVEPLLKKKNKVAVIISDALRYEIGKEFVDVINTENRFSSEMSHGICSIPSFTQIGMAALLPHNKIQLNNKAQCQIDGTSTASLAKREVILKLHHQDSRCFEMRAFRDLNTQDVRDQLKNISLVYIYSNVVDNTGDKRLTEKDTFKSVHEEIQNLRELTKKLASANFTNILITADHGFIYRSKIIDEGQKIIEGKKFNASHKNRRFLITDNAIEDNRLVHIAKSDLPYESTGDLVFPKALNVFKVSGAGMQFLHGGLSVQELIIPYIKIRKERKQAYDVNKVEIQELSLPKRISGYQAIVNLLQKDAVGEKILPRICKIGFYSSEERSLSNQVEIEFDNTSEEIRNREFKQVFDLSSDIFNYHGATIFFVIYDKDKKFNHYKTYYKKEIQVFISEEKDFDI